MIQVSDLVKVYDVPLKEEGLSASIRGLFSRKYRQVRAVDGVTFRVEPGERVGFLGPNGAGKTTTLKMLSGLLHPTAGSISVAGFKPAERQTAFLKHITLVMGQKRQLLWDLPCTETFALNRALFDVPTAQWTAARDELVELLELSPFLDQPVRNLSLGQRMRAELAAALLHRPQILFLDEPTIGLDVQVQGVVRRFISKYNAQHGATILLTSHDMDDVAAITQRVILIDKGSVRFDGSLEALSRKFGDGRRLLVRAEPLLLAGLGFEPGDDGRLVRAAPASEVNALLSEVLRRAPHADVAVVDPPLETVLLRAFGEKSATEAA